MTAREELGILTATASVGHRRTENGGEKSQSSTIKDDIAIMLMILHDTLFFPLLQHNTLKCKTIKGSTFLMSYTINYEPYCHRKLISVCICRIHI